MGLVAPQECLSFSPVTSKAADRENAHSSQYIFLAPPEKLVIRHICHILKTISPELIAFCTAL